MFLQVGGNTYQLQVNGKTFILAGAIGDPYIQPIDGSKVWKMPNFEGYSRMIQCILDGKQLTINVETTLSTKEETEEAESYAKMCLASVNPELVQEKDVFIEKEETFMRKLWIKYGDDETIIDMNKLKTINNNSSFLIDTCNIAANIPQYDCHESNNIAVRLTDEVFIIISKFNNPQVRTGFNIIGNISKLENKSGVLCNRLYKADMIIDTFTDETPITQLKDREPRSMRYEQYFESTGKQIIKELPVY